MLVVDDDSSIRMLCAINLHLVGIEVLEADNGERALEIALTEQPDLAVLDVRMPRVDGFEVLTALRGDRRTRDMPVVFLTSETRNALQGDDRGAVAWVRKPFDPIALAGLVARALGRPVMGTMLAGLAGHAR